MSASVSPSQTVDDSHSGPLAGVTVLDLSRLLPGPFCSQMLRDMGATVIKVEDTAGGDYSRYYPPLTDDGNSAVFHALNRGKKSIVLNLKLADDVAVLMKLAANADVLIESFRPGVLARLGFGDAAEIRRRFPRLIVCSISGYGQTGPDSLKAGHDVNYLAKAGVLGMMREPALLPVQVADLASGAYPAAIQILAGLHGRSIHGQGCYIDVSMVDNSYLMLAMPLAKLSKDGQKIGNGQDVLTGKYPCYDVYKTKDGFVSVGNLEPKFWKSFVDKLGLTHLKDKAFVEEPECRSVRASIQSRLSEFTGEEIDKLFKNVDTCVEIVRAPEDRQQDPQLSSRRLTVDVSIGEDRLSLPISPLCMSGVKPTNRPGPMIGEHNDEIVAPIKAKL